MVRVGLLAALTTVEGVKLHGEGVFGAQRENSLIQTWNAELEGSTGKGKDTPVTRVVKLLENMKKTLSKEMEEDEDLYDKLACWCNNGKYEKKASISAAQEKIEELENSIEEYTARSKELKTRIQELEEGVAADKKGLAEATKLREKQLQEFQGTETDSIQAIENLKAALIVLGKHHGAAFFAQLKPESSFVQTGKDQPTMRERSLEHALDSFILDNGYGSSKDKVDADKLTQGFLQNQNQNKESSVHEDVDTVRRALKSAKSFVQAHHEEEYYPSYNSQSGEILGVMKQLKEEMEADLGEAQKTEQMRSAAFAGLRAAKSSEIEEGEKMSEQKEDELAATDNALAEAKEDLVAENGALSEDQKFLMNLDEQCANGDANFQKRKAARLEEIKAVSETIEILTADEARDAMSGTYSFMQISENHEGSRKAAAAILRQAAAKTHSPLLSALATGVELDAFTKVRKAIDDMIKNLNLQQADEVKKNDWCTSAIQENEMATAKSETARDDLTAKAELHGSNIVALEKAIMAAKAGIAQAETDLQRASEDRKTDNFDFQTTVADQTATIEVLHKALNKLAEFYDAEFLQTKKHQQTPPVAQAEYKPNAGATGVMSMIEKLISDAKDLCAKSKKGENEAQASYEALVADTNASVDALQNEITTNTKVLAKTKKAKLNAESDLMDTVDELEGLHKQNSNYHAECDYVMKNFDVRQTSRAQEVEALQQAKQILSGASLG